MKKILRGDDLHAALVAAGVVLAPAETIRRIVIDARAGQVVVVHVQLFGDERLLEVAETLDGVVITRD